MSKKTLQIPVTPFTFKVVTARYGHPIQATMYSHRELCTYIQVDPVGKPEKFSRLLSDELEVTLPSKIGSVIARRDIAAIGYSLHQLYTLKLYEFIYAQIQTGEGKTSAYGALKDFYRKHRVEDDDFSFESAYRGWLRYQDNLKQNLHIFHKNERVKLDFIVIQNIAHLKERLEGSLMRTNIVSNALRKVTYQYPNFFKDSLSSDLIAIYLYRELCGMSFRAIATKSGRSYSTARFHHANFLERVRQRPSLRFAAERVTDYLLRCKISVLLPRRKTA